MKIRAQLEATKSRMDGKRIMIPRAAKSPWSSWPPSDPIVTPCATSTRLPVSPWTTTSSSRSSWRKSRQRARVPRVPCRPAPQGCCGCSSRPSSHRGRGWASAGMKKCRPCMRTCPRAHHATLALKTTRAICPPMNHWSICSAERCLWPKTHFDPNISISMTDTVVVQGTNASIFLHASVN